MRGGRVNPSLAIRWICNIVFLLTAATAGAMDDAASLRGRPLAAASCAQFLQQHRSTRLMAMAEGMFKQVFLPESIVAHPPVAWRAYQASWVVFQKMQELVRGITVWAGEDLKEQRFFTVRIDRPTGLRDYVRFFLKGQGEKVTLWYSTWTEELGENPTLDQRPEKFNLAEAWPNFKKILGNILRGNTALPLAMPSLWRLNIKQATFAAIEQEVNKLFLGTTLGPQVSVVTAQGGDHSALRLAIPFPQRGRVQVVEIKVLPALEDDVLARGLQISRYEIAAQTPYQATAEDLYYGSVMVTSLPQLGHYLGQMIGWILAMPQGDRMVDPWRPKMVQELFSDYYRHYHF